MSENPEVLKCKQEIQELQKQLTELRGANDTSPLVDSTHGQGAEPIDMSNMSNRRVLKGLWGKIYALHWAEDSKHLVSASQDGKLVVWNGFSTNKVHSIPLRSQWVMTCAYSPSGNMVACGGLDNLCSIYKLPSSRESTNTAQKTFGELAQHEGYLSCCRFAGSDNEIITSSGDSTCILWDVENMAPKATFTDHSNDVMTLSVMDSNGTFVSGACDYTARLWDYRKKNGLVMTFVGNESDVNSVSFFPDGNAFATGSDDSTCRLFDVRASKQLGMYYNDKIVCGITSVAFSHSGRIVFAGYDDHAVYGWDVAKGTIACSLFSHDNRVSCLGVAPNGSALCTGSWDTLIRIWA